MVKEATVEVHATYTVKVISSSAEEAQEKAKNLVLRGVVRPDETYEIIRGTRPISYAVKPSNEQMEV